MPVEPTTLLLPIVCVPPLLAAASWDYKNSVMKVSAAALSINGTTNGIIFTLADLGRQARICIEHKRGFSLTDILRSPVGGGRPAGVTYAVFSGNKKCCPVSWVRVRRRQRVHAARCFFGPPCGHVWGKLATYTLRKIDTWLYDQRK